MTPQQLSESSPTHPIDHPYLTPIMNIIRKLIQSYKQDVHAFTLLDAIVESLSRPPQPDGSIPPSAPFVQPPPIPARLNLIQPFHPDTSPDNPMFLPLVTPYLIALFGILNQRLAKDNSAQLVARVSKCISLLMFRRGTNYPITCMNSVDPKSVLSISFHSFSISFLVSSLTSFNFG